MNKQHFDEEVADATADRFFADLKLLVEWKQIDGRPEFTEPKTDDELWSDFLDPLQRAKTRAIIERNVLLGLAPKGEVERFYRKMTELDAKMTERNVNGPA